jgi:hypothetical protein
VDTPSLTGEDDIGLVWRRVGEMGEKQVAAIFIFVAGVLLSLALILAFRRDAEKMRLEARVEIARARSACHEHCGRGATP